MEMSLEGSGYVQDLLFQRGLVMCQTCKITGGKVHSGVHGPCKRLGWTKQLMKKVDNHRTKPSPPEQRKYQFNLY